MIASSAITNEKLKRSAESQIAGDLEVIVVANSDLSFLYLL
jgi:hypothetical protein